VLTVTLDCAPFPEPTGVMIDSLARLFLIARKRGATVRMENMSQSLLGLIRFCGLLQALGVEPGGQPEEWEEPGGVQEEGELADPTI
jgi:hypothetical protein